MDTTTRVLTEAHFQAAFEKYGSDKAKHGYAEFYAAHMPVNPKSILEIGVKGGASIRAWRELYPSATIIGLDLFEEYPIPEIDAKFIKGDQTNYLVLQHIREVYNPDVIIDDGSHNSRDQMISFFGLFTGKDYFIEDLHCCQEEFYRQGLPYEGTAQMMLYSPFSAQLKSTISQNLKIIHVKSVENAYRHIKPKTKD